MNGTILKENFFSETKFCLILSSQSMNTETFVSILDNIYDLLKMYTVHLSIG